MHRRDPQGDRRLRGGRRRARHRARRPVPHGRRPPEEQRQPAPRRRRDAGVQLATIASTPIVFTRWEGVELMNFSPFIYAFEQRTSRSPGAGTLDGQADADHWWQWRLAAPGNAGRDRAARNRLIDMQAERRAGGRARVRRRTTTCGRTSSSPIAAATSSSRASPSSTRRCGRSTPSCAERHGARRDDPQPRSEQRRLQSRVVPRRPDRATARSTPATTASRSSPAATTMAGASTCRSRTSSFATAR